MRRTQLCWAALLLLQFAKTPTSATFQPEVPVATAAVSYDLTVARQQIIAAQFECYLKIINDPPNLSEGPLCNRTWDGWLCWEDSSPGTVVQLCPEYFRDFDPSEKVTKVCGRDGQWFRHPESNRIWSNYTQCSGHIKDKLQAAYNVYYLAIVGQGLSVVSLLISLWIFFYFKSLSCQRISLHKNMFLSFILNSICSVITLSVVTNNQPLIASNPMSCKVLSFLSSYALGSNYFWMLCEGIYLHTLIIVAVFAEEQQMHWYFILGWVFPLVPATIYTMARCFFYNDSCWISAQTHLLYIVHGPIYTALLRGELRKQSQSRSQLLPLQRNHSTRESAVKILSRPTETKPPDLRRAHRKNPSTGSIVAPLLLNVVPRGWRTLEGPGPVNRADVTHWERCAKGYICLEM
ncbi:calcitonin gene-related peptide type 1 receptor-like isoform X1 [Conger conger]|uniref:calcitonin gene-related peptide type 1 receptor-like isoform X1 n=1 Tax=Conger conger TaxID=82655 RepID=UPI002A5AF132|nr:calcitonin gene-related peptide type 1 receptor-like isoform X1 [Conger conger]XP_061075211.1 calcitonin gene-related peptide type 1 receptor-like isoform X1 [Conger conger]